MKITAQVLNDADFKKTLKRFAEKTQTGIEEGIKTIGESTGRALASKVRPYGLSARIGKEFERNIGEQVDHVRYGANMGVYSGGSIQTAHENQRRQGRVRIRKVGGRWNEVISKDDAERYKRQKQANAGMVKAGWVAAVNQATGRNLKRIPRWISRHIGRGRGTGRMYKRGGKTEMSLSNNVPYARQAQKDREVTSALAQGRSNALKYMLLTIDKATRGISR